MAATPDDNEREIFEPIWVDRILAGDSDADSHPVYALSIHQDKWFLVARTGYSFTEINTWIAGEFKTKDEALGSIVSNVVGKSNSMIFDLEENG
jgi:hypothetical protein